MNLLDKKIFYFHDARVMYSLNEIQNLVSDKVTSPNEIIRMSEHLAFKAGDVLSYGSPVWSNLLNLAIDQPSSQS